MTLGDYQMRVLVNKHPRTLIETFGIEAYKDHLGLLITPRSHWGIEEANAADAYWAADNDCFNGFDEDGFRTMLDKAAAHPHCQFVSCPDVVADAAATFDRFRVWEPIIHANGLPVALVAQDGLTLPQVPWDSLEAIFIGGSTDWKLSADALRIAHTARSRGKWVHMGRVNTKTRLKHASTFLCNSVDGTGWSSWSKTNIPLALKFLRNHNRNSSLWEIQNEFTHSA